MKSHPRVGGEILQPMAVPWDLIPFGTCCTCHNRIDLPETDSARGVVCHHQPFVITLVTSPRRCKAVVATLWHLPMLLLILCYTYKKWLPTGLVCHLLPRVESSAPLNNTEQCGQLQQMNNLFIKQREFYFLVASDISQPCCPSLLMQSFWKREMNKFFSNTRHRANDSVTRKILYEQKNTAFQTFLNVQRNNRK